MKVFLENNEIVNSFNVQYTYKLDNILYTINASIQMYLKIKILKVGAYFFNNIINDHFQGVRYRQFSKFLW